MQLGQRQRRTNEDECPHLAAPQLEVFDTVGKPLTTSLLSGVPVHVVAARLGHFSGDPAITLRVYAHVIRSAEAAAAAIFAQAIKAG